TRIRLEKRFGVFLVCVQQLRLVLDASVLYVLRGQTLEKLIASYEIGVLIDGRNGCRRRFPRTSRRTLDDRCRWCAPAKGRLKPFRGIQPQAKERKTVNAQAT